MNTMILLAFVATLGMALAAPQDVQILKSEQDVVAPERFRYDVVLSDQTEYKQSGLISNPQEPDQEKRELQVEGQYSFVSKEGDKVRVSYTADATGYKPLVYINEVLQNPPQ
ncbi:unnamed protein product [Allacma fusca]|uniref:Uncharacterized protein n=1 Tax=Allacma fusca TaxID=39272 RepID=A0A8J2L520_9HEXA|nr:unnamed protein product [Allacma fusca]